MTEPTIDADRQVGSLVSDHPAFGRVFDSHDIDFCCGGDQPLRLACREADVDLDHLREELVDAAERSDEDPPEWDSLSGLVDHVVDTHHQYLADELPALHELVRTVRNVPGENHPELDEVEREFGALADELRAHTSEEESDVFPLVEKLDEGGDLSEAERARLDEELDHMVADHEATADHLERIADLTDGYAVPDGACPSYRSMLDRLEALERDTHDHVHKENNVMFRRVESRLADLA